MDLALNNLQRLICHKTQQTKPNKSIWPIDGTVTSTTFPGKSRTWSNIMMRHSTLFISPELEPLHQIQ